MFERRHTENLPATRRKAVNRLKCKLEPELIVEAVGYIALFL